MIKKLSDAYKVWTRRMKNSIKVLMGMEIAIPFQKDGTVHYCPVCEVNGVDFYPLSAYYSRGLFENQCILPVYQCETVNLEFYSCSNCGASDRDRLYALYFNNFLKENANAELKVLDIAPAAELSKFLQRRPQFVVRSADLFMEGVDDVVDITNMTNYEDSSFDIFICSHVLEHVNDDLAGMRELYRILSNKGWGIAMVPILLGFDEVYENPSITDEAGRWKHFAQNDHVRMYSKPGFISRLESVGFKVQQITVADFGTETFRINGIHLRSVLYIVSK